MLLGIAIVSLFLFAMAGTAVAAIMAAHMRALVARDADSEAANTLASAENIVDALAMGGGRTPEGACIEVHTDPNNLIAPSSCPTDVTDWTSWMTLPGREGCVENVLEGCWTVRFSKSVQTVHVPGRTATPVELPVWTATVVAAARCDRMPPSVDDAADVCIVVTDETAITYETNPPPVYPTLLYSGRLVPATEDTATADCPNSPDSTPVWCSIPERSRPPADVQVTAAAEVFQAGLFVNDRPGFQCPDDRCKIAPTELNLASARTLEGLPPLTLEEGACTSSPAVVDWTRPSFIADRPTAVLPDDIPADTPGLVVASGSVTITETFAAPIGEPLLIVSGCHIVIDGPCAFEALIAGYPESAPHDCDGNGLDLTIYDPNLKRRLPVSLTNVIIVAAGGMWAADLTEPASNPCPIPDDPNTNVDESTPGYQAPVLTITGSVITGHAGATSRLRDCDLPIVNGAEKIIAGYERISELPNPDQWATADIAWWPGREHGVWRRQGAVVPVSVEQAPTGDPGLTVNPAAVTVTEGSTAGRLFSVELASEPSADVTVTVSQQPTPLLLVTPTTLTFTTTDWGTPQYVTVSASAYQDDDTIDSRMTVTLTSSSTDSGYSGLQPVVVDITITDDDIPPALVVSVASLTVAEGGSDTFTVSLTTAPSAPVTVSLVSGDTSAATVTPASLTFTDSDFDTPQTVTVHGTEDSDYNDESTTVTATAANGGYDTVTASVAVAVTDDDEPTATDAAAYVTARNKLAAYVSDNFGTCCRNDAWYHSAYIQEANTFRAQAALDGRIPLGEADNSRDFRRTLPGTTEEIKDAIDTLAVAVGLPQAMIDTAEGN